MLPTLKHFPGKGEATVDAHLDLPVIPDGDQDPHLLPFRAALRAGAPLVMTWRPAAVERDLGHDSNVWCVSDPDYYCGGSGVIISSKWVLTAAHVVQELILDETYVVVGSDYQNAIFIAEHGSWNRTTPIGYRITIVDPGTLTYRVFAQGWLQKDGRAWGRPVDVLVWSDGSLLVSDDRAGAIYRIYRKSITSVQPGQHRLTQWAKQKSPLR